MYGKYPSPKKTKASGGKKKLGMGGKSKTASTVKKKSMKMGGKRKKAC